jgi:hypothetical protein
VSNPDFRVNARDMLNKNLPLQSALTCNRTAKTRRDNLAGLRFFTSLWYFAKLAFSRGGISRMDKAMILTAAGSIPSDGVF